jgi:hypothetical protein
MTKAIYELLWIHNLLEDLEIKHDNSIKLYCYNKTTCDIDDNPIQHNRTKHVEVDRHFIKKKLERRIIETPHISSREQLANLLTKAVSSRAFYDGLNGLRMSNIYALT